MVDDSILSLQDFIFKDKFEDLTDEKIQLCLDMVNTMFHGSTMMYSICDDPVRDRKRKLLLNYLVGWQLLQMYPDSGIGVTSMGAIPITHKRIDNIEIGYRDLLRQSLGSILSLLGTNWFGIQAQMMIQSSPESYMII